MKSLFSLLIASHLAFMTGCSTSSSLEEHRKRADEYFQRGLYEESIVEYLNVLHAQPTNRPAQRNLGIAYYQTRDLDRAYPLLVRAARWNGQDIEVLLKLASLLSAAGSPQEAEEIAREALELSSGHGETTLVWANAVLQNGRPNEALEALLPAHESFQDDHRYFMTLGATQAAVGDSAAALDAFNHAVRLAPDRADTHMARGELLIKLQRMDDATVDFQRAESLAPGPTVPGLRYALHLKALGDTAAARARLDRMLIQSPRFVAARYERAALDAQEDHTLSAQKDLDEILSIQPDHLPARMLRAQLLLRTGNKDASLDAHRKLTARFPRSIPAGLATARLLAGHGDIDAALNQLDALLNHYPDLPEAVLMWAELSVARGDFPPALARLARLHDLDHDTRSRALLLTGLAHRRHGNSFAAVSTYEELANLLPGDPQPHYLAGLTHREAGRISAAADAWGAALEIDPIYFPALQGLVVLRLEQGRLEEAQELIDEKLLGHDDVAALHYLRAAVATARDDIPVAELSLRRAIELKPDFTVAYRDLGRLYVRNGRVEDALRKLTDALATDPGDETSLMLMATLLQQSGRIDEAVARYEEVLIQKPDFVTALNNLAYLYAVRDEQSGRALQLALRARELAPRDPAVADTLGMIAFQQGSYRWSRTLLSECEAALGNDPEVMHHLGQACLALGEENEARDYFEKALASNQKYPGHNTAELLIGVLKLPLERVNETHAEILQQWLAAMPATPPVLARQAALERQRGEYDVALDLHQQALSIWPEYIPSLVAMTRMHLDRNETEAALETARHARSLRPSSPALTFLVGQAAYQSGDYPWALSLYAEALNAQPDDANRYFHHALAALMTGRVQDAYASAVQSLRIARATDDGADRYQAFVDMLAWYATGETPLASGEVTDDSAWIHDPWLRPLIRLSRARFAGDDAARIYHELIQEYPGWPLPRRDLVSWRIARGDVDDDMLRMAREVRDKMSGNISANRNHAIALAMHGSAAQAAFYLKQLLEMSPDDQEAASWLNKIEAAQVP